MDDFASDFPLIMPKELLTSKRKLVPFKLYKSVEEARKDIQEQLQGESDEVIEEWVRALCQFIPKKSNGQPTDSF